MIRHFASTERSCKLLLQKWKALKELVFLLKIPFDATKEFQDHKLTLNDVYGKWIGMQLHLQQCMTKKQFKSGFAKCLHDSLVKRSENIFKNPLMLAALYLDPRYHYSIDANEEKSQAVRETLLKLYRRIHVIETLPNNDRRTVNNGSMSGQADDSSDFSFEFDEQEAVAQHFNPTNTSAECTSQSRTIGQNDIETTIDRFQPDPFPSNCSNILQYWESIKDDWPEMYELAMVIFCVPPTEVQIERDFSNLKCVFTDRRCNLIQSRLESILLIHLNKDLFYKVNQKQIDVVKSMPK